MEKYETMTITESEAKKHGFPAKAIGYWAIVGESGDCKVLHRLNKDGRLGSDRPNNILTVLRGKFEEMSAEKEPSDERLLTAKASNGETVVICRTHTVDLTAKDEPEIEKHTEANIKMDEPKESKSWKNPKIGTRKTRWIEQLLEQMKFDPFGQQIIEKVGGESEFVKRVIADTDPDREFGKAYSSISSAIKVWNVRNMKGKLNG